MKKAISFVLTVCSLLVIFSGCGKKPEDNEQEQNKQDYSGEIVSFLYCFDNGWNLRVYYKLAKNGEEVALTTGRLSGEEPEKFIVDDQVFDDLKAIINEYRITSWNGFNKSEQVCDASSFTLNAVYDSGAEINASGYAVYPTNYYEAHEALTNFFEGLIAASSFKRANTRITEFYYSYCPDREEEDQYIDVTYELHTEYNSDTGGYDYIEFYKTIRGPEEYEDSPDVKGVFIATYTTTTFSRIDIQENVLSELKDILTRNDVRSWDGAYDKGEDYTKSSFLLSAKFDPYFSIFCSGGNGIYPAGFDEVHRELTDFLESLLEN